MSSGESHEPKPTLPQALAQHDLKLLPNQIAQLEHYCQLLWGWNEKLNLTRHTDYGTIVARDVLDTLQLANLLRNGEQVLDVGSGGGVPGVLLAILRTDLEIVLCESVGKKASALTAIVAELNLPVPVYHCRAESLLDDFRFDTLVARAVGPLWKILKWFEADWDTIGRLLLIKGPRWVEERAEARHRGLLAPLDLRRIATYPMVDSSNESVILQLTRRT